MARKRDFPHLWLTPANAAASAERLTYQRSTQAPRPAEIEVDRKVLADLAVNDAAAFAALVAVAKAALPEDTSAPREDAA